MFFAEIDPNPSPPAQINKSDSALREIPALLSADVKQIHSVVRGSFSKRSPEDNQSAGSGVAPVVRQI
jgi:hypothetical protein